LDPNPTRYKITSGQAEEASIYEIISEKDVAGLINPAYITLLRLLLRKLRV
jgi:hypothetical protein